jgi:hypothetical protein
MNLQDYKPLGPIRAATILTTAYVPYVIDSIGTGVTDDADIPVYNQLIVYVAFTQGSLTSLNIKIETSPDNETTWYQETARAITGGVSAESQLVHNYTASGNYIITIPIKYPNLRISVEGVGTVTGSSLALNVAVGTV